MPIRAPLAALVAAATFWSASAFAETVTIAAEDDWAPYSSIKPDQSGPEGLAPELVKAAFKTQNIEVRFLVLPFARCLLYTTKGKVVACFDTAKTTANEHDFHWHPTPLFKEEVGIFGRSDVVGTITPKDLEGQTLGVTVGYTYPTSLMENPRIAKVNAASDGNLLKMLVARRVDYILLNTMPGYHKIRQDPALAGQVKRVGQAGVDGFWLSFSKVHPDGKRLCDVFEKGLLAIKANGEYDRMMANFKRRLAPAS